MNYQAKIGDVVWYITGNIRHQAKLISINGSTHAVVRLLTGPQAGTEFNAPWGIIQPLDPMKNQIDVYTELLQEIAGSMCEVANKYDGSQLPYRWEVREVDPMKYLATIEFTPNDVLEMNAKNVEQQREYLRARFSEILAP
jgi:hypothetical protein